ncbi:hypothetical protein H671_5g14631 [Cricetulus griseus]|nr:hypothetical protein H671_5g14631 [Cricetulus griseus]
MGNLTSQPIYLALQELLHSKGLKLEKGQEVLEQLKEERSRISEKDSSEETSSDSEEELELLVKKMERSSFRKRSESSEVEPTAPGPPSPPYNITSSPGSSGRQSFCLEDSKFLLYRCLFYLKGSGKFSKKGMIGEGNNKNKNSNTVRHSLNQLSGMEPAKRTVVYVVDYIDGFSHVEPSMHLWDEA